MEQHKPTILNCYELLKHVLLDAFKVPTLLFTPPYKDITKIDQGMRAAVWSNYNDQNTKIHFQDTSRQYRMYIIKSNLGFYNILAIFGSGTKPDFISVGPFRDEELSPGYFTHILKESHIAPTDIQEMKYIYERMPMVPLDTVVNVMKHIIGSFEETFRDIIPDILQYSEQSRTVNVNRDILDHYSIEFAETYQKSLFQFLSFLKTGDTVNAKKALQDFLDKIVMTGNKSMRDHKAALQTINDYCHMALLHTDIHPLHVIKLAGSVRMKIENMTSLTKLEQMASEICHKYCLLVKNYANPDSSRLTKDVIAYIQLHLDEELSLRHLAAHFQKNASVLSNTFSKETGQTLTKFIHQTRIQKAIHLFNTTDLSVSEVAMTVGYPDFSYFSKVFSKNVGCSPREYKSAGIYTEKNLLQMQKHKP